MSNPFYYGNSNDCANTESSSANWNAYRGVVNWSWGNGHDFRTWTIQPKNPIIYGSFGDYAQDGFGAIQGVGIVLAIRAHPAVIPATKFKHIGNIISEQNHKEGIMGGRAVNNLATVSVYQPLSSDPNFIGIGLVFGQPEAPPDGYYCVHKSYVKNLTNSITNDRKCAIDRINWENG